MSVDVYKQFSIFIKDKFLSETYFVESCLKYISRFSKETDLNNFSLRLFLDQNNIVKDGCDEQRPYCDMNFLKNIQLTDLSSKIIKPFNKTIIQNKEINFITSNDVWDIEEF